MEELVVDAIKNTDDPSALVWALLVWVLAREFLSVVMSKFKGKSSCCELLQEKLNFLYIREKKRETIQEYKNAQRNFKNAKGRD